MTTMALLTEPFLLKPTPTSVQVAWFTAYPGTQHWVEWGSQKTLASSRLISGLRTEAGSPCAVWRHQATLTPLPSGQRVPYRVVSTQGSQWVTSQESTLMAQPPAGMPLRILLTSDHQLKPMVAANLQKVVETVGAVDAVFFAGDLVNTADRAGEWFGSHLGNAFFPTFQGLAHHAWGDQVFRGGAILQSAPLFPALGNHDVVECPGRDPWFNSQIFDAFFGQEQHYYAVSFGDVRLIVLSAANMWRHPGQSAQIRGRFQERQADLPYPERWGGGQKILEPIHRHSPQFTWLRAELNRPEWHQARFRLVMLHHPMHSLGDNAVPPFTDPIPMIERHESGAIAAVHYRYPPDQDYLLRDLQPLLEQAGTHLVLSGHCHLWNRFVSPAGVHYLETSNVGNSYGAAWGGQMRREPSHYPDPITIAGDPGGLTPCLPSVAPLLSANGVPLPFVASNEVTVFSILSTVTGRVSSYRFHTRQPNTEVILFDEFELGSP
ncbi:MAG: metallophosphoesterase [Synechococcales cyanobacterium]